MADRRPSATVTIAYETGGQPGVVDGLLELRSHRSFSPRRTPTDAPVLSAAVSNSQAIDAFEYVRLAEVGDEVLRHL